MMRLKLKNTGILALIITILLPILSSFPALASSDPVTITFGINEQFPATLNYYLHTSGGYTENRGGTKALAFTMAMASLGMTNELLSIPLSVEDLPYSVNTALSPLRWALKYFDDPYARDNRGYVSFYDLAEGENSYSRASKKTVDQALMIRAMAQGIALLQRNDTDNADIPRWKKTINKTYGFMERLYDAENGGWGVGVTPIDRTEYTTDWSKTVESNAWGIISLMPVREIIAEATGLSNISISDKCLEAMEFLHSYLFETTGQVRPFSSRDGTVSAEFTTCRDASLFGLAAMECYRVTVNGTYLQWAKQAMDHALVELWDNGFGGFFGAVSDEGDVLIAGKKTEDNLLAGQLLCQLVIHDTEDMYEPILAKQLFILRNIAENIKYPTAVDRKLFSNGIFNARTQGLAIYSLSELPHIIYAELLSSYPIGRETPLSLNVQLGYLPRMLLSVRGGSPTIDISLNITGQEQSFTIQVIPPQGTSVGSHSLDCSLSIREVVLETLTVRINCGGDILIPQGVIFLLAMGVIVGVVIVIITPPERLKEWMDRLFIQISVNPGGKSKDHTKGGSVEYLPRREASENIGTKEIPNDSKE